MPEGAVFLEQLYMFGRAHRDRKGLCHFRGSLRARVLVRPDLAPFVQAGGDGVKVTWVPAQETLETGNVDTGNVQETLE